MGHGHHHHGAECDHHHAPADFGRAFIIGIALNSLFIAVEVFFGLRANSLALLADAGHNASDVLALVIAYGVSTLSRRGPSERFTYGLRGSSILGSLANAVMLLLVVGGIAWESVLRLLEPAPVQGGLVMAVAATGVVINGATALLFMSGRKDDLNVRGAYLHMAADAAISLGVVISGFVMGMTGWLWLDPVVSLAITVAIVVSTWGLLKESLNLALDAVPEGIDPAQVRAHLRAIPGVREVHDLHIWAMSTTEVASSFHLIMPAGHPGDVFLHDVAEGLKKFRITHTTIQIEIADAPDACPLAPDHVV